MRGPRWLAKMHAGLRGFFWMPCPRCGKMFGGHEIRGSVADGPKPGLGHATCCPPDELASPDITPFRVFRVFEGKQ